MNRNKIDTEKLNHLGLISYIKNPHNDDNLYFEGEGLIGTNPDTWSIMVLNDNKDFLDSFIYESEKEYLNDLKIVE